MYTPRFNREEDREALLAFMRAHPFATVVSAADSVPHATLLPVTVREHREQVLVRGHFARANEQWRLLDSGETLVLYTGPHAYISPTHYDKWESVPTWNYIAVQARGGARTITFERDPAELEELLAELIGEHESSYRARWDELPGRYREGMMRGIVGFELTVTRLDGKVKLSQNKSLAEQRRIASALLASGDTVVAETGREMERRLLGAGETEESTR